jgi:hypothetical protein
MNSSLTGPIEGTLPDEANVISGIIENRKNKRTFLTKGF